MSSLAKTSILLVTNIIHKEPKGGRELLCKLNSEILKNLYGSAFYLYELQSSRPSSIRQKCDAFKGYIDGLSSSSIAEVCALVHCNNIKLVFVDGSNLGAIVVALKRCFRDLTVITFYHNVEARFFWGGFLASKSIQALAVFAVNLIAELRATRLSDGRICLSKRDGNLLKRIYGKGATHIVPLALKDKLQSSIADCSTVSDLEPFILFVGGSFYANRDGIGWFVEQVVPRIAIKVCIVGKGMEDMRIQLEIPDRVEVIGTVDNLAEWYRRARFVVAPIFDGSGMKTKVAEALMFGKKVVGTPQAFSGYEQVANRVGWCCSSPAEFVAAIHTASTSITSSFDLEVRAIYEEHFSLSAATTRLSGALCDIQNYK